MKSCNVLINRKIVALFTGVLAFLVLSSANSAITKKDKFESMTFFEAGHVRPAVAARRYTSIFKTKSTRYIYTQVRFKNNFGKKHTLNLRAEYYRPDGSYMGGPEKRFTMNGDWNSGSYILAWGWSKAGNWQPGKYKVKIYYNKLLVAVQYFTVKPGGSAPVAPATLAATKTQTPPPAQKQIAHTNSNPASTQQNKQPLHSGRTGTQQQIPPQRVHANDKRPNLLAATEKFTHQQKPVASSTNLPKPKLVGKAPGHVSIWEVENKTPYSLQISYNKQGIGNSIHIAPYTIKSIYLSGGNYSIRGKLSKKSIGSFSRQHYFSHGSKYLSSFFIRNPRPAHGYTQPGRHGQQTNSQRQPSQERGGQTRDVDHAKTGSHHQGQGYGGYR